MNGRGGDTGVARFFALTFAITWLTMIPVALTVKGLAALPPPLFALLAVIGSSGPSIAAVILVLVRKEGLRSLRAAPGATTWARRLLFVAVALTFQAALHMIGGAVGWALFDAPSSIFTLNVPQTAENFGILVVAPLGEELGWRGFAQRRLGARLGALRAALVIGPIWYVWHAPMWIAPMPATADLAAALVLLLAGAIVYAALFEASGGSLLVMIAAHAGIHLDNPMRGGGAPLFATTGAMVVAAVACAVWLSRRERAAGAVTSLP